jgi:AmmeMemoRadiSam system protein B
MCDILPAKVFIRPEKHPRRQKISRKFPASVKHQNSSPNCQWQPSSQSKSRTMTHRPAIHAGSWYSSNAAELDAQMSEWLGIAAASSTPSKQNLRAIIAPHAGYRFSGQTAAHAYCALFASPRVERVFILGPSHHYSTRKCLLSQATTVETPFGSIAVDTEINFQLALTSSSLIGTMDAPVDAAEHSLEMQFPFVARASRQSVANGHCPLRIVPIMIGSCLQESEAALGRILAPYFDDPCNVFVISSDFCHFGRRCGTVIFDCGLLACKLSNVRQDFNATI